MKRIPFVIILIMLMLPLCVLPLLFPDGGAYAGALRIGSIQAEIYTLDTLNCDCCPPLWGGGIANTPADLSTVQVGDWATITLLDGTRLVLECAAIFPCVRVGSCLVSQYGLIQAEGDVIIYDKYKAYMFVRL